MNYETMVERVAKALAKTYFKVDNLNFDVLAKAAIKAMREPTDNMILACKDFGVTLNYQAMIDAALNEKPVGRTPCDFERGRV